MTVGRFGRLTDAPASLLLAGIRIIDPSSGTDAVADLAILDGLVARAEVAPAGIERIDARGLIAAPAFCDLHTHLRDPGGAASETIESGARAAARGGFTTVCAMPNTEPSLDSADAVVGVLERARDAACRVRVIGAATVDRAGMRAGDIGALASAGVVGVSDDGAAVPSGDLTRDLLRSLGAVGLPLVEHAEDAGLAAGGVMRAGPTAVALGLRGWPAEAEVAVVERDLALAEELGARLHLTHLSTAASVDAVRRAKSRGVRVTCDVTPHHLALAETWVAGDRRFSWEEPAPRPALAYDATCRVNPPLTLRADAAALLAGVADGTVDAIATDHAPHPPHRKLVPFDQAAPGLIGLETALSLGLAAVEARRLPLPALIAALSTRPAAIIGERRGIRVGEPADIVVFDPGARWQVERAALVSASANTPLLGMELPGVVRLTVADGRVTYRS